MKFNSCVSCFLCGSTNVVSRNYLTCNSNSVFRNIAYLIPDYVGKFMTCLIPEFRRAFRPVLANKKYFTRHIIFCRNCLTGWAHPFLSCGDLSAYYKEFYWKNRDSVEGKHLSEDFKPNIIQIEISKARVAWTHSWAGQNYAMQWHLLHQDHVQLSAPLAWLLITIPIWMFVEDVK